MTGPKQDICDGSEFDFTLAIAAAFEKAQSKSDNKLIYKAVARARYLTAMSPQEAEAFMKGRLIRI